MVVSFGYLRPLEGDVPAVGGGDHLDVVAGEGARAQYDPGVLAREIADDDVGLFGPALAAGELAYPAGGAGEDDATAVRHEGDLRLVRAGNLDVRRSGVAWRAEPAQLISRLEPPQRCIRW
jgi:hypothetical protein